MRHNAAFFLSEVIESNVFVADTKRVEQVEDGFCHHRRTAEVVLDVFGFGEEEFLTDLGLALVDGLETLTSEPVVPLVCEREQAGTRDGRLFLFFEKKCRKRNKKGTSHLL